MRMTQHDKAFIQSQFPRLNAQFDRRDWTALFNSIEAIGAELSSEQAKKEFFIDFVHRFIALAP